MADERMTALSVDPRLGIHAAGVMLLSEVGERSNSLKFRIRQRITETPKFECFERDKKEYIGSKLLAAVAPFYHRGKG